MHVFTLRRVLRTYLHYEITYSSSFPFSYLGTILYWTGTLWEYRQLCQVLFFSFSGVLNIVIWGTLTFRTTWVVFRSIDMSVIHQHSKWSSVFTTWVLVLSWCYLPVTNFLMQIRDLLVGHICMQISFCLLSPGGYNYFFQNSDAYWYFLCGQNFKSYSSFHHVIPFCRFAL